YDAEGNIVWQTRTIDKVAYVTQSGYDAAGRLLWTVYPDGDTLASSTTHIAYDGAGRVKSIPASALEAAPVLSAATYDAAGHLLSQSNGNNTTTTYNYSASRGWIVTAGSTHAISTTGPSSAVIQSLDYTRDAEGKITGLSTNNSTYSAEGWTNF